MKRIIKVIKSGCKTSAKDLIIMLCILVCTTAATFSFQIFDQNTDYASMLFLLAVFLVARMTEGYLCGVLASLISVLLVNFLFTYPNFAFNFTLSGYPIAILTMLVVSVTTSALTTQAKRSAEAKLEIEREKTRSNLLRAISHDLRTPLTGILGASSVILENDEQLSRHERLELIEDMRDDAQWLIRMVENLLTITRMDGSKDAKVVKNQEVGEEVLGAAVSKFKKQFPEWKVLVHVPDEILLIPMDVVLIEQVLTNLMENVVDHGTGADQIWLSLKQQGDSAVFSVCDNGCGIDLKLLPTIFEGKVTAAGGSGDSKRNMGIGLSVCYTIIRAHGGTMKAENRKEGGAALWFTLPLEEDIYEQSPSSGG